MNTFHTSVLLQETIDLLSVQTGRKYIDATLGGGGHSFEILRRGGKVLGIDADQEAIDFVKDEFKNEKDEFVIVKGNFRDIDGIAREHGFENIAGILFDLGVSSHQFDDPGRGFSFQREGPLDMRMDRELKVKAADLINILTKGELHALFTKLGEERFANTIINSIIRARRVSPIKTTVELSKIINKVVPARKATINPATRIFQALRIAVNDELNNLKETLPKAVALLGKKGRIAVISFHSLEDRIVKNQFREWEGSGMGRVITQKPVIPSPSEIEKNKRSRSAKLRVFEKN